MTARLEAFLFLPEDDQEYRRRKVLFVASVILVVPVGVIWGGLYFAFGERAVALIPLTYSVLTAIDLMVFLWARNYELLRFSQQGMILVLPVSLQVALGGYVGGSAVIVWALISVLMAVLFGGEREAVYWFLAYAAAIVGSAAIQRDLSVTNSLPHWLVIALFPLNIGTVSLVVFAVLRFFVSDRRKLRELEVAYLTQEQALRQSEKMATLGTLVAGVAHELNNPAAAAQRAAEQLSDGFSRHEAADRALDPVALDPAAVMVVEEIAALARRNAGLPADLDALERSDLESEVEELLSDLGVADPWLFAPPLVNQGLDRPALEAFRDRLDPAVLPLVLTRVASGLPLYALLHEVGESTGRLSEIVSALKSFSYLGEAPVQWVDLHEGLDNTLLILRSKFADIEVRRDYGSGLPRVPVYGSELNQVWTNLLDNAARALGGSGTVTITTAHEDHWLVVTIEDDGPGIPDKIKPRIFDPFFTTMQPGQGTGLGLATSFAIVTDKHHGRMSVESRPGATRFIVKLPLMAADLVEA